MTDRERHIPKEGPREEEPEWLAQRVFRPGGPFRIGASDAGAACCRSSYRTPLDLYLNATGEIERTFDEATERRMRRGRRLQPVILAEYATEQNVEVFEPCRSFIHPMYDFMEATPDGIVVPSVRLVEVKASNPRMFSGDHEDDAKYGQEGTDWVPDDVLFQCQQQMAVMDMDTVDVVVMFGVFVMRVYIVPRNDDLIEGIVEAEQELVERVINHDPPEPQWTHPRTKQLIQAVNGLAPNSVSYLTLDDANYWLEYQRIGDTLKSLEARRDECRNRLLWAMGSAELGRFPQGSKELRRVVVQESLYTEDDVAAIEQKVGQVKRRKYERLIERKVK